MGIFDFLKARPDRTESEVPLSPRQAFGAQYRSVVAYEEVVTAESAMKHPYIFRCINKIAESVQSVPWYAEVDEELPRGERPTQAQVKAVNELLKSPNDVYSPDQFRYWMALNYCIYGRVPFKVGLNTARLPSGLYPLTTRWVRAKVNNRGIVEEYLYGDGENATSLPTRRRADKMADASYASEIFRPTIDGSMVPENNWHGANVTALSAIGLPAQVIRLLLQRAADTASGHPNTKYIIAAEKTLTNAQKTALKETLYNMASDEEESGQVLFLYNTKVDVTKLDNDLSDIHSKMPMDDMARQIAGAFGIPVALIGLGAADGAKFASNYMESRRSFWEDTVIPAYLKPFATGLTLAICPPGVKIMFDYDQIPAIADIRIKNAVELSDVSFLSNNEKREVTGWEPIADGDAIPPPMPQSAAPAEAPTPPEPDDDDAEDD